MLLGIDNVHKNKKTLRRSRKKSCKYKSRGCKETKSHTIKKNEQKKEKQFQEAYKFFTKIANVMVHPPKNIYYNIWDYQYAYEKFTPSQELIDEQIKILIDYEKDLQKFSKDSSILNKKDIKEIVISAYKRYKSLVECDISYNDLRQAYSYLGKIGGKSISDFEKTCKEDKVLAEVASWNFDKDKCMLFWFELYLHDIYKELLEKFDNEPHIIAINLGVKDPKMRLKKMIYMVYRLALLFGYEHI